MPRKTRTPTFPHKVQTRIDPELQHAVEVLTDDTDAPGIRHRRALRALYDLALTHPECPPALYSTLAAHRPGRWVTLHNTRPDLQPRMAGAELLPPQHAALLGSPAHQQSPYPAPAPQIPQPLNTAADAFADWPEDPAPAPTAAHPGHRRPKLDRLGRPVTVQTRPLTDLEMQQEGNRVTALALAEATGQPLPPFELMPWERIVYEGE